MKVTLTELCDELNNWFDTKEDGTKDRYYGTFTVSNGTVDFTDIDIKPGQYYRIIGSVFNDGVWQVPFPQAENPTQEETTTTPNAETNDNGTDDTQNTEDNSDTDDTVSSETDQTNTEPVDTEPSDTEPSDTEPSDTEPTDTEPTDITEPTEEEPEDEEPVLIDEVFDGAIWLMRVPSRVIQLLDKINDWNEKYGDIIESPFTSESFGGYSYQKNSHRNYNRFSNTSTETATSWKSQFSYQLRKFRKLKNI